MASPNAVPPPPPPPDDPESPSFSEFKELDSEIWRMTLDADKILDSIRNEATEEEQRQQPMREAIIVEEDHEAAVDEDDDMSEEMERLESITTALRNSLHEDKVMPASPIAIKSIQTESTREKSFSDKKENARKTLTTTTTTTPVKSSSLRSSKKEPFTENIGKHSAKNAKSPTKGEKNETGKRSLVPNSSNNAKKLETQAAVVEPPASQAMVVSCSLVWALVGGLLLHGHYFLLDSNGDMHLPLISV